jgi:hypothetical protein
MRHPSEGVLRRLVDEPAGVPDDERAHVAGCADCLRRLETTRAEARLVGAALTAQTGDPAAVDTDAAWARLSAAPASAPRPVVVRSGSGRWRAAVRRPAVAAVSAAVLVTGAGVAAANDWLPIFQTEQVAAVEFSTADLVAVPDLTAYGDLEVTESPEPESVPDAATAEQRTGLDVPDVGELPTGVTGEPAHEVLGRVSATFTFDPAKAAQATDGDLPAPPAGLAGSRFRIDAGPGVAAVWTQDSGAPSLVVARAQAPTVFSDGVPFETARDYLLSLPGLPAELADQLRAASADGSTLPVPVPADLADSEPAEVDGVPATVVTAKNGLFAGVVWVEDGVVTVVGGTVSADEVLDVARGLR